MRKISKTPLKKLCENGSGLEIDFVTRYRGGATLIEVKATTGNTKITKTFMLLLSSISVL